MEEFSIADYIEKKRKAVQLALDNDISSELLDEDVIDAAEDMASNINNDGIEAQIDFLIERFGPDTVIKLLEGIIHERA
jgi:hypothetical protein